MIKIAFNNLIKSESAIKYFGLNPNCSNHDNTPYILSKKLAIKLKLIK